MGTFINGGNTFSSDATLGIVAMSNPGNVILKDAVYATAVLLATQTSNYLKAMGFNFNIPSDATITGVTVTITKHSTVTATTTDGSVKLVKGGSISGNDKASAATWGTSDSDFSYGSSSDLWGLSLTPADINNSTFGIVINAVTTLAATISIDYISIQVDYIGSNRSTEAKPYISVGDGMSRSERAN